MSNNMNGDLILEDISTGREFLLESGGTSYYCGRGKNSQIMSQSILVSREHCVFMRSSRGLSVIDWGSANGIFINGRPQQAKVMIELQINDLIGLGCPDTKPFVPHNPANGAEGTNKVQIKTIFRLKLPESPDLVDARPELADPRATISADNKRRHSRDSSEARLPEKKLKTEEGASIPDVIDITDSDDEAPGVSNGWSRPSTSTDPFAGANLSVIKYEPPYDSSASYEKDTSAEGVHGNMSSVVAGEPRCHSNIEQRKSQDDEISNCPHTSRNAKADKRSGVATKKPASSGDTQSREDGHRTKAKSFQIRINHLGQLTRVPEEVDSRVVSEKLDSSDVMGKLESPVVSKKLDSRVEHPGTATSSVEPLISNEREAHARRTSEDSASDNETDDLRRAGVLDMSSDQSSHSSWEKVEDFSIPGYNADENEPNGPVELPDKSNNDPPNSDYVSVDQGIKYEPELQIMDVDESIYTDMSNLSQSLTPMKVKRVVKNEPITEYSQFDVVALSDDEDNVFPASQLFGDEEDCEAEKKIKVENELSDDNDEFEKEMFDRREDYQPDLIIIPDSDDEDNPWYDRLIRAELNVSRESVIKEVREITGSKEFPTISPTDEDAPMSPIEEDAPMSPIEDDAAGSPIENDAPVSPIEEYAPGSPTKNNVPKSPIDKIALKSPIETAAQQSRVVGGVLDSPAEKEFREALDKNVPEDLFDEFAGEINDSCFVPEKKKTQDSGADMKKQKDTSKPAKKVKKEKKPTEEHTKRKVSHSHRSSSRDDSTSAKLESAHSKASRGKGSHHHAKRESTDRSVDSESGEAKTSSHKSKRPKQRDEHRRHSSESKAAGVVDSANDKRSSTEEKTNHETETPVRPIPEKIAVVLLEKVDYPRRSVQLVEAPIMGNNQRRGFSCNIKTIAKSTNNTDVQTASTSGVQSHVSRDNGLSTRKEHRLSTKEKKEFSYYQKVEEKRYLKDQKHRRMINKWADGILPPRKTLPGARLTRAEKDEIRHGRKEKLKEIADKKKEQLETNELPAKRIAKAKAKVTERSRNDFLVTELADRCAKEPANAERTSVDNTDRVCTKEPTNVERTSAENRVKGCVRENADVEGTSIENRDKGCARETANIERTYVDDSHKVGLATDSVSLTMKTGSGCEKKHIARTSVDCRDKDYKAKEGTEKPSIFRKEYRVNGETHLVTGINFYRENDVTDSEVSSGRLERDSATNGEAPPADTTKSPKGKKRRGKSLDSGKENAEIDHRLNNYTGEMVTNDGANAIKISPSVRPHFTRDPRRSVPIDNRNFDRSKIESNAPRAATMQNGTSRVLEESKIVDGQQVNNNVLYEKEPTIAPRDPRIQAGKPGKLKSLLKKKGRWKGDTPKVVKRVSFDDLNTKIQFFEINPGNTLKKCDFKDAPSTIKNQSKHNDKVGMTGPKLEEFLLRIFEWNPVWLQEQKQVRKPPPIVNEKTLMPMIQKYESYDAYYEIAEPLLALELWHGISKDYDNGEVIQKSTMKYSIVNNSVTRTTVPSTELHVTTLMIEVIVNRKQWQIQAHPVFGDLIFFEYVSNIRAKEGGFQRWKVFGYVTKFHPAELTPFTQFNRDLLNYVQDPYKLLTYTVMTKPLNPCEMQTNKVSRLGTISYLRSNIRMIQALQHLPNSTLLNMVLHPKIEDYQLPPASSLESYPLVTKDNLNAKQMEAVARVTEAVEQKLSKICLIKGPPGTGKSKVIVNLITQIHYGRGNNRKKPLRILVCAPSNAAIDEIVLRLLEIRKTFQKGNRFNMVRIGREQTMHPMVKEVSLTELAKKNVKSMTDSYMSPDFSAESIEEEKHFLEARKNSWELELACTRSLTATQIKHLRRKIDDINAKYNLLVNRQSAASLDPKESAKLLRASENTLLSGADVIACTLTSCYTNTMESIFVESDASISVCIVDEATQSMEAETLVPLMLGVKTLVLVGDNNQLPATVLSQKAKQLGLDQSLFGRIQGCFNGQEDDPIIYLDTQYRMSYPVAFWPNRYFYDGALRNSANLRNLPFNFYKVINLDSTQDIDKFSNTNEANFVANLVYTIMARSNLDDTYPLVRIGIITPYNNQKTLVTRKIKERIAMLTEKTKKKFCHEVNTVDSFQGQERDIIIMSCVRSNGIGFLSDRQRLCVALTRAKHSLILCGNFTAFQRHPMWNALLSDARSRGVYLNMRSSAEVNEITRHIIRVA